MDKISYGLGISMASNLKNTGIENLNLEELIRGISDVFNGNKLDMDPEEAQKLLNDYSA